MFWVRHDNTNTIAAVIRSLRIFSSEIVPMRSNTTFKFSGEASAHGSLITGARPEMVGGCGPPHEIFQRVAPLVSLHEIGKMQLRIPAHLDETNESGLARLKFSIRQHLIGGSADGPLCSPGHDLSPFPFCFLSRRQISSPVGFFVNFRAAGL